MRQNKIDVVEERIHLAQDRLGRFTKIWVCWPHWHSPSAAVPDFNNATTRALPRCQHPKVSRVALLLAVINHRICGTFNPC